MKTQNQGQTEFCFVALQVLLCLFMLFAFISGLVHFSAFSKAVFALYLLFLCLACVGKEKRSGLLSRRNCRLFGFILLLVMLVCQIYVAVTQAAYITKGDPGAIMTGAGEIEQYGHLAEDNLYFNVYPHQLFTAFFYGCVNRLFVLLGASQPISVIPTAVLNAFLGCAGGVFFYFAAEKIYGSRRALLAMLLLALNISYTTQVTMLYPHTLAFVFAGFALWCAAGAFSDRPGRAAAWRWLLCGLAFGAATSAEGILAIGLAALMLGILFSHKGVKGTALALGSLALGFAVFIGGINFVYGKMNIIDRTNAENEKFPLTHWVMIGLSHSEDGDGIYSENDYQTMMHLSTKQQKQEYALRQIEERLKSRDAKQLLALIAEKETRVWTGVNYGGNLFGKADQYLNQAMRLLLTLLIVLGCLLNVRRTPSNAARSPAAVGWTVFIDSWLVGLFLFFILWETSAIYLHSSQFVLLFGALTAVSKRFGNTAVPAAEAAGRG